MLKGDSRDLEAERKPPGLDRRLSLDLTESRDVDLTESRDVAPAPLSLALLSLPTTFL